MERTGTGMVFETLNKDLLGRIGRLKTKRGIVETPLLLPVVNPLIQTVSPSEMKRQFGCQAIIVNAYLLKKNFGERVIDEGLHNFLQYDGTVMTDSGAYQILIYGQVETTAEEIVRFEEEIETDIAVILDVPTGWNVKRDRAVWTVDETLRRASLTLNSLTRGDILWVGPVQGGNHLDLVRYSAVQIGKMDFQINALGSPTQVMERYLFNFLVDMVMTAKQNLPPGKPLHLFGAGHPFMFSLAVAMGCDMFDSAAYAIYAREGRYMTVYGTVKLKELDYFPCSCRVCTSYTPKGLLEASSEERMSLLAIHNLSACYTEIKRVKQAIKEGRLWELLELRARSHPSLMSALKALGRYSKYLEIHTPVSKSRGLFFFDSFDLNRPETIRHKLRLSKWTPPTEGEILVLLPQPSSKPFHGSKELKRIMLYLSQRSREEISRVDFCFYCAPFGVTPVELDEVFPLSQFEISHPLDPATVNYVIRRVEEYIIQNSPKYKRVILHPSPIFSPNVDEACKRVSRKMGLSFSVSKVDDSPWSQRSIRDLVEEIYSLS